MSSLIKSFTIESLIATDSNIVKSTQTNLPSTSTSNNTSLTVEHSSTSAKTKKKKTRYIPSYLKEDDKCSVCGDKATGNHYLAVTCEGCKGFFRRSVQQNVKYTCKYEATKKSCDINVETRNDCQACRFQKCLDNKMQIDSVFEKDKRIAHRNLIKFNSEKKEMEKKVRQILDAVPVIPKNEAHLFITNITKAYWSSMKPLDKSSDLYALPLTSFVNRTRMFIKRFMKSENLLMPEGNFEFFENLTLLNANILRAALKIHSQNIIIENNINEQFPFFFFQLPFSAYFLNYLESIATLINRLELTNEEISLIAALVTFPRNFTKNESIYSPFYRRLCKTVKYLVYHNSHIIHNDKPLGILRYPTLLLVISKIYNFTSTFTSELINIENEMAVTLLFS